MIIENSTSQDSNELRRFLLRCPGSLFYSEPRYLSLLKKHLDCDIYWLTARSGGEFIGLLPYAVKRGKTGTIYNSLPYYGSNGGVVTYPLNHQCKKDLIEEFYHSAEQNNAMSATLITNPLFKDADFYKSLIDYKHIDNRIAQITPLPEEDDEVLLMGLFSDPRPRNIRRARKENIIVKKGGAEMLPFLYETHFSNMSDIGGKPKNKSFFDEIENHMKPEDWSVFTAFHDGRPIAALLLFYFNNTVEYFTPVTVHKYRSMQPMALIVFEAMQDAINRGMTHWNWGGTWLSQTGVYDFKKKWGACNYDYHYFVKVYSEQIYDLSIMQLESEFYGFYTIPYIHLRGGEKS